MEEDEHVRHSVHIIKQNCVNNPRCTNIDDDHLEARSHSKVQDFRSICPRGKFCPEQHDIKHYDFSRHPYVSSPPCDSRGVHWKGVPIDFKKNYETMSASMATGNLHPGILNFVQKTRPVHRCGLETLRSILGQGCLLSRKQLAAVEEVDDVLARVKNNLVFVGAAQAIVEQNGTAVALDPLNAFMKAVLTHVKEFDSETRTAGSVDKLRQAVVAAREQLNRLLNDLDLLDRLEQMARDTWNQALALAAKLPGLGHQPDQVRDFVWKCSQSCFALQFDLVISNRTFGGVLPHSHPFYYYYVGVFFQLLGTDNQVFSVLGANRGMLDSCQFVRMRHE